MTLKTFDSSILSFIILILMYANAYNRSERVFMHYKVFMYLLRINIALIIIDILGWVFNGLLGQFNMTCNIGFNLLLYIVVPIGPLFWVIYADYQVFMDENRIKKIKKILMIPLLVNAVISVSSLFTGWFFYVDLNNIYHRGPYFVGHIALSYGFIIYSFFFILRNKKLIDKRCYRSLLLYYIPQTLGTTLQMISYGVSYNWTGMMVSLLIVYFNIQDRGLNIDYLTGTNNRRQLDTYIRGKIRNSKRDKTFSAILIDLDKFKQINDEFGHDVGDDALKESVRILRESLNENDFIARFGGDEFVVVLNINSPQLLKGTVEGIQNNVEKFNTKGKKQYRLNFSMGYDIYDYNSKMNFDDFFKHIDELMYIDKNSKRIQLG